MCATILNIDSRSRFHPATLSNLDRDFTYSTGGTIPDEAVLNDPHTSLYCLDDTQQRVIFAELPPQVELSTAPFYYQVQYDKALRLFAMPYATLIAWARENGHADPSLIFLYSIGRCGSTLTSKVLNRVEGVTSFSEPDVFTQIAVMRAADGSRDTVLKPLLHACTQAVCKASAHQPRVYSIKFRSECLALVDLLAQVFPQASNLFLYRGGIRWASSFLRLFEQASQPDIPEEVLNRMMRELFPHPPLFEVEPQPTMIEGMALVWARYLEHMQSLFVQGIPMFMLRYEDLMENREVAIQALFEYCGLSTASLQQAWEAFEHDSQAGTALARSEAGEGNTRRLSEQEEQLFSAALRRDASIPSADYRIPGTFTLA